MTDYFQNKFRTGGALALLVLCMILMLSACGKTNAPEAASAPASVQESAESTPEPADDAAPSEAPAFDGLSYESTLELQYATGFSVWHYAGGYAFIDIPQSGKYLVIPENGTVPSGVDGDIVVLQKPLDRIYLAATSAYSLFDAVDAADSIRMTGTQASGWFIDSMVERMNDGRILFGGRYSEPDYETLIDEDCCLAVESTMIYHTPKIKEMLEDLGIPVLVDRSSYEEHPLGRTEWVKLYAVLTDREAEAEAFFDEQAQIIRELKDFENTGKTVAYFSVNTDGSIVIRQPSDYIPTMIDIAGGVYAFEDLPADEDGTSLTISMEEFYATAVDADYLIYNASIESVLGSVDELIAKDDLFANFKAVQNGNVWTTGKSFYQQTDIVGQMIRDMNLMLTDADGEGMTFLTKVN